MHPEWGSYRFWGRGECWGALAAKASMKRQEGKLMRSSYQLLPRAKGQLSSSENGHS